jgi:molybdenum cofactor guanylyltransferase
MGRDKSLLPYRGGTLVEAVAGAVAEAVGTAILVGGHGEGQIPDLYPGEGPLGGILTALADSGADWTLIVACDMPGLTSEFLRKLVVAAEASPGDALVPRGPAGLEPLCAVYHRRAQGGLSAAFARGIRKIATALEEVALVPFTVPELTPFQNVNTPEEWARYAG